LREALLLAPQAKALLVYEGADPQSPSALPAGAARGHAIAVSVIPITDTVKEVADGLVVRTVPRDTLVDARGPWMLDRDAVTAALDRAALAPQAETFVDLCRISGMRVQVVLAK
jgi:2-C-methyl-D-erythritol 4-phosphate cytidylyltransferase